MSRTTLVIANPAAGRGRARALALRAVRRLEAAGTPASLEVTRGPGHAAELAAAAVRAGAGRVVACGGDGTIGEVAGALAHTGALLGILPGGRGNDLAGALGVPSDPDGALALILSGSERIIDLGVVNGRRFCTVVGVGFDAHVSERAGHAPLRFAGGMSYSLGVLAHIFTWRAPVMRIAADGETREGRYLLAAVSNTGRYGGGVRIAPDSSPDDGRLDACLVQDASRWRLLRIFPTAFSGRHVGFPEVETVSGGALRIETDRPVPVVVDGENAGTTPVTFEVDAAALRVAAPARR